MMWAPIANNVVAVAVLTTYLLTLGPAEGAEKSGGFTAGAEALLGIGSTLGIVVQFLVLLPYLKAGGVPLPAALRLPRHRARPHLRLGMWTVLFVVVNQIAYTSSYASPAAAPSTTPAPAADEGTGYTIYSNSFLLTMVPHSIITVSLATAMLPMLSSYAADGQPRARSGPPVSSTLRSAYALVVPVAVLFAVMALDIAHVIWGYGSAAADFGNFAPSLALFGVGLVLFTAHYLVLRGFYALEQTRRVFWIQCVIAATNIVAAVLLTRDAPAVGDRAASGDRLRLLLRRRCGHLLRAALAARSAGSPVAGCVRFLVRLVIAVGDQRGGRLGAARGAGRAGAAARARCTPCSTSPSSGRLYLGDLPRAGPAAADHRGHRRHERWSPAVCAAGGDPRRRSGPDSGTGPTMGTGAGRGTHAARAAPSDDGARPWREHARRRAPGR